MRARGMMLGIAISWLAAAGAGAAEQTVAGVLVDPATYLQTGKYDAASTEMALDGGQSLALLDPAADRLYVLLAETPGEDPNELVYDVLNQEGPITVTGEVLERGGVRGIVPKSVTAAASGEAAQADAP